MFVSTEKTKRGAHLKGPLLLLLVLALAGLSILTTGMAPIAPRAQPLLLNLAAQEPEQTVSVIVQKTASDAAVETLLAKLDGKLTQDLHIINAFAAEIKAKDVPLLASADGVRWVSFDAPVRDSAATNVSVAWATQIGAAEPNTFANSGGMVDSPLGPNGVYGTGADNAKGSFSGFDVEVTPGNSITKLQVLVNAYVPAKLVHDFRLQIFLDGDLFKTATFQHSKFEDLVGGANAGTIAIDITNLRHWQWADLDGLEVGFDQANLNDSDPAIYYDAVGLQVTSEPGNDVADAPKIFTAATGPTNAGNLQTTFNATVRAPDVWNESPKYLQGQGVVVAVVDSGITKKWNLGKRLITSANFNDSYHDSADRYGHGTFVGAILGSDGKQSKGEYIGIAPKVDLLNVRVSDDQGMSTESDVVRALQWVYDNKDAYKIRVVNMSLNSSVPQSYHTSPMDAAVEILWFRGIVVVVSAGNDGTAGLYAPANDPFVITVGATDDRGTADTADDVVAGFSAYGNAENGAVKPDLVAPGTKIVAYLPGSNSLTIGEKHADHRVNGNYFYMSGTSMATPMVSGAVAMLLEDEPNLNPDQVKYRLMATANTNWPGYDPAKAGAGYLDIYAAVHGTTTEAANTGTTASQLLWTGSNPITWGNVNWNSVNWNSVNWNSVNWNSVNWNSVNWNSDYWGP